MLAGSSFLEEKEADEQTGYQIEHTKE